MTEKTRNKLKHNSKAVMSDNDELDSLPSSTSQRKKSLADEIFELTNPAPKGKSF
jgi:hypothetical protein